MKEVMGFFQSSCINRLVFPFASYTSSVRINMNHKTSAKPRRLEGKVVIITGAARKIGAEAARLFIENGILVVLDDIQDDHGRQVTDVIGGMYLYCDVCGEKQVEETVRSVVEKHGKVDIFFNNVRVIDKTTTILDLYLDKFDNIMAINAPSIATTIKHAGHAMVASDMQGSIICTSSVASLIDGPGQHVYTTFKVVVAVLVRSTCRELGPLEIRVNCVSPFGVATPLSLGLYNMAAEEVEESMMAAENLKGVMLKARHVAKAVMFLSSDESTYVSGQNLAVDRGFFVVR